MNFNDKTVLITGGTGSFGKAFVKRLLEKCNPKKIIVLSRDELKQWEMREMYPEKLYDSLRFFLGDVRDRDRLYRAFRGVDVVVHAAALKQVPAAEYNPMEAIKTNILGAGNVISAAIDNNIEKVIALSTDKAANPINLYGATKLCAEKLFIAGNVYSPRGTKFSIVRYGNVVGSRGSVVPLFINNKKNGVLPITDDRMTRFWITLEKSIDLVLNSLTIMQGGEIFVPRIPSMRIVDLAKHVCPECEIKIVGIRPGEKLYETLITEDESRNAWEFKNHFTIYPAAAPWKADAYDIQIDGKKCKQGFVYTSNTNDWFLTGEEMNEIIQNHKDL